MNKNLSALILLILAVGIYFTLTRGMFADAQAVKKINDQYVSAMAHAAQLISVRDQLLKQYNAISDSDRSRLDKMIPSTVDNIRLIIDLNSIALRYGFSLSGIKAAATAESSKSSPAAPLAPTGGTPVLDTVTVSFGATAGYDTFIQFLQALESNLRVMDLTRLSVSGGDGGLYSFQVQFKTYWLRQ